MVADVPRERDGPMGGLGSGRCPTRKTTGDCLQLDIRTLVRMGVLELQGTVAVVLSSEGAESHSTIGLSSTDGAVQLRYSVTDDLGHNTQAISYRVPVVRTPCFLGGSRQWWRCPNSNCARRCAILYLDFAASPYFVCRSCLGLVYPSQRASPHPANIIDPESPVGWAARLNRLASQLQSSSPPTEC